MPFCGGLAAPPASHLRPEARFEGESPDDLVRLALMEELGPKISGKLGKSLRGLAQDRRTANSINARRPARHAGR